MRIHVPVILGPTAVGKTEVALKLAEELKNDIISCDSRQIYKFMNIGTAKPTPMDLLKIQHWLIDYIEPSQSYSAYQFYEDALSIIRNHHNLKKGFIVCGGTGLYAKTLIEGFIPQIQSDISLRTQLKNRIEKEGKQSLWRDLEKYDPITAKKLHPNDMQRVIRALQVYFQTGLPLSDHIKTKNRPENIEFLVIILTMDREPLYERINKRVDLMIKKGLWDEFLSLRRKGYGINDPGMHCVGYQELFKVEDKVITLNQAIEEIKKNSRNYAKRQFTWFANKTTGVWFNSNEKNVYTKIKSKIVSFIEK